MAPLIPIAAALALAYGGYEWWKGRTPKVQSLRTTSVAPTGEPVKVQIVVPVTSTPPVVSQAATPLHPNNTGTGASYSPPPVIASSSPGKLALAPIVITATGASSLGVQTTQDVQNAMNTMGYAKPALVIDGKSGQHTQDAIKAFQTQQGLTVDGTITAGLKDAIQTALAVMAGPGADVGTSPTVQNATPQTPAAVAVSMGTPVSVVTAKDVQHALNLLGASPALVEDGKFGPLSQAACKAFQISHGLVSDGVAGPKTKTALVLALSGTTGVTGELGAEHKKRKGDLGGAMHPHHKKHGHKMHGVDMDEDDIIDEPGDVPMAPRWGQDPLKDFDGQMIDLSAGSFGGAASDAVHAIRDRLSGGAGAPGKATYVTMAQWWTKTHPGQAVPPYWSNANTALYKQWRQSQRHAVHHGDPGPDQELPPDTGDPLRDFEGKMLDISMGAEPGPDQELAPDAGIVPEESAPDTHWGAAPGVGAVVNGLLNITAIADWLSRCGASDKAFATEVCAALKKYGHADTCKWARKSPANLQKAVTAALTSGPPASSPELRAAIVSALSRHGATVSPRGRCRAAVGCDRSSR